MFLERRPEMADKKRSIRPAILLIILVELIGIAIAFLFAVAHRRLRERIAPTMWRKPSHKVILARIADIELI